MEHFIGIDFGTTNSAVAIAGGDAVRVAALWRTVLYFEPDGAVTAGAPAITGYLEAEGEGRLVQSIKSHLASASFPRIQIYGRTWTLEELIAEYLRQLRRAVDVDLGRRAVVGRPVRYWGAETADDDARAVDRMRSALARAGFDDVVFELEPIAAAASYAARLDHDELVMVADFGGGTSDFSLLRIGPRDLGRVLGSGGIGIGGDSFDARIIDAVIAPALGRGTRFRDEMGGEAIVPVWLYHRLRRWHHLSFLKEASTMRLLDRIAHGAFAPEQIDRLVRVVRDDLGLPLHQAVERAKIALTAGARGLLEVASLGLAASAARDAFEEWIAPDLDAIDSIVDRVLSEAGASARDVDRVFATGGSSLVPAVRERLAARFGAERVVGGEELTSVCWGLAAQARRLLA
jgi:hypothetical chaperone protein